MERKEMLVRVIRICPCWAAGCSGTSFSNADGHCLQGHPERFDVRLCQPAGEWC